VQLAFRIPHFAFRIEHGSRRSMRTAHTSDAKSMVVIAIRAP
jgi:hypothetical protein